MAENVQGPVLGLQLIEVVSVQVLVMVLQSMMVQNVFQVQQINVVLVHKDMYSITVRVVVKVIIAEIDRNANAR